MGRAEKGCAEKGCARYGGYEDIQLLVRGIEQAQSVEPIQIAQALENLQIPYRGILKEYVAPFSRETRNALRPLDYTMAHWQKGRLIRTILLPLQNNQ